MKQITLSEGEFKSLLDGVKHSAAIDDCRPMLQYIRIEPPLGFLRFLRLLRRH